MFPPLHLSWVLLPSCLSTVSLDHLSDGQRSKYFLMAHGYSQGFLLCVHHECGGNFYQMHLEYTVTPLDAVYLWHYNDSNDGTYLPHLTDFILCKGWFLPRFEIVDAFLVFSLFNFFLLQHLSPNVDFKVFLMQGMFFRALSQIQDKRSKLSWLLCFNCCTTNIIHEILPDIM